MKFERVYDGIYVDGYKYGEYYIKKEYRTINESDGYTWDVYKNEEKIDYFYQLKDAKAFVKSL